MASPLPSHVFLHAFHSRGWQLSVWKPSLHCREEALHPAWPAGPGAAAGQGFQERPALDLLQAHFPVYPSLFSQPRKGVVAGRAEPSWGSTVRHQVRMKALQKQYTYQRGCFLYYFINLSYYAISCVSLSIESNMYLLHITTLPDITEDKRTSRHSPWLVKLSV